MNEIVLKTDEVIEPSRAEQLKAVFVPFVAKLAEFEAQYNEITAAELSKETCAKAKRLRLDIAKVRTGTENARKLQKEECIRVGRAIDGFANIVKFATIEKEEKLEAIEKHFERIEAERIQRIADKRATELAAFECYNVAGLGIMDDSVYANFITGAKANYEARKAAEKKAEEERLRLFEVEKLHNQRKQLLLPLWDFVPEDKKNYNFGNLSESEWIERYEWTLNEKKKDDEAKEKIRIENERLRQEAIEREKKVAEERKQQEAILAAERAKAEADRRQIEEKARIEREKAAEEARKIQQEQETKFAAERAERAKIEAELKAKVEAERQEKQRIIDEQKARDLADKKAAAAPDKEKLIAFSRMLFDIELPIVTSDEARVIAENTIGQISFIAQRLLEQASKL